MHYGNIDKKKILLTRPEEQSAEWVEELEKQGAEAYSFPLINISRASLTATQEQTLLSYKDFDLIIFTSSNAVSHFITFLKEKNAFSRSQMPKVISVGPATKAALEDHGISSFTPEKNTASGIAEALDHISGSKILLPQSAIARQDLEQGLKQKGAEVVAVPVYTNTPNAAGKQELNSLLQDMDIVIFASPSAVNAFHELASNKLNKVYACIGPTTAQKVEELGFNKIIVASEPSIKGLMKALNKYYEQQAKKIA